jgi:hypothetical protein
VVVIQAKVAPVWVRICHEEKAVHVVAVTVMRQEQNRYNSESRPLQKCVAATLLWGRAIEVFEVMWLS